MTPEVVQVLVVHGHPTTRRGLEAILEDAGFQVDRPVDEDDWAGSGRRAMVCELAGEDDLARVDRLTAGNPELVVVGCVPQLDAASWVDALCAGASAVVDDAQAAQLLDVTVLRAAAGEVELPLEVARRVSFAAKGQLSQLALDTRQHALLRRLAQGVSDEVLAAEMSMSGRTLQRRKQELFATMQVRNRSEAVAVGLRNQLLG